MELKKTEIYVLADRSGSMQARRDDAIGGFNAFVEDQKKEGGNCNLWLTIFDDEFEPLFESEPIQRVKELTRKIFVPRNSTALYDSQMKAMALLEQHIDLLPDNEKPENVIFVTITDGQENDSKEFKNNPSAVRARVTYLEKEKGWTFIYLGENQDAVKVGESLGIDKSRTLTYAGLGGTQQAYHSTGTLVSEVRQKGATRGFSQRDRDDSIN